MTVCADGPGGAVLGTVTNSAGPASVSFNVGMVLGVNGEEPATAGYTYEWRNAVFSIGGRYSTTSCF
jgi:hypothetical protein